MYPYIMLLLLLQTSTLEELIILLQSIFSAEPPLFAPTKQPSYRPEPPAHDRSVWPPQGSAAGVYVRAPSHLSTFPPSRFPILIVSSFYSASFSLLPVQAPPPPYEDRKVTLAQFMKRKVKDIMDTPKIRGMQGTRAACVTFVGAAGPDAAGPWLSLPQMNWRRTRL